MEPSRDILRLVEIMSALRNPKDGCPWDLEQTFSTISPYTIEEAYEVADAIERNDAADLQEELGDLLLQVVYHAQLAAEAGLFDLGDVVEGITRKMIRRHPHVFGDAVARSAGSAKGQWERIKAEEKAEKLDRQKTLTGKPLAATAHHEQQASSTLLDDVPGSFPALTLALKVQKKAASVGFDWDDAQPILAKLEEETAEFLAAVDDLDPAKREDEMGDLLFTVVNLARFHAIDPEQALRRCVRKFRDRLAYIEHELRSSKRTLHDASLEEMEALWIRAKTHLASRQIGS